MTEAQESTWAYINNSWPIDTYVVDGSGYVQFVCDDGDTGWIDPEGEWGWDKY
jgi:hypothetical protein